MNPLPTGVRIAITAYLTSSEGIEIAISLQNLRLLPDRIHDLDAPGLIRALNLDLPDGDWRAMTDAEIANYLEQEGSTE